jgi:multicomponent Na+:H+ antiporter subunit G
MIAAALHFNDLGVSVRTAATVIFVLMTAPVAAHMIGRAAYFDGAPLFENTQFDELCDRYDPATHALDSRPCAPSAATDSAVGD